jgi:hypothetical protein
MNGYIAFYKGKRIEVHAETSFEAQQEAARRFKARKAYEVSVMLAERNLDDSGKGEQVVHSADF